MQEEKVFVFNRQGEKLIGLRAVPDVKPGVKPSLKQGAKKDRYPAIVLVHGFGVTKEEYGLFDVLAESFFGSGFLVYRFDFSGCGESEGDYTKTSLTKMAADFSCILDFVKSQDISDSGNIGILAQSFGTSVAVSLSPDVRALVLMGSISHPKTVFSRLFRLFGSVYNPKGVSMRKQSDGRTTKIGPGFWTDLDSYDLPGDIKKIKCPVLFINGSEDDKLSPSETDAFFSNVSGLKERIIIEGASHGLNPKREDAAKIAVAWFKRWMC
ncbi:MAG: alpha/beta fold hydrolase [archaeon]|nr:alpha/beta fold hydrolase [archaeon]